MHSPLALASRILASLTALLVAGCASQTTALGAVDATRRPPNIIVIVSDDLGVGELGCYGQRIIRTPSIDRLASEGTRFTNAYSGSCVCAPSRCTLLTGRHTGHAAIRDNRELSPSGQEPLPAESVTLAELLDAQGYRTAAIGKWGLGPAGSVGDPTRQGFDHFFGYLCQRDAHNHCPPSLDRDGEVVALPGNQARWSRGELAEGARYAPDLFRDEAIAFLREDHPKPFFLLFATTVPHVALQVPEDSLREYRGAIPDAPYDGAKGYLSHQTPHAAYAAMVTRMDRDIGAILAELEARGLAENTIVLVTSDNGPTYAGGADSGFFESAQGRRGLKGQLYEGGIRVPLIVRWPGRAPAGRVSDIVTGNWDLLPTLARAGGVSAESLAQLGPIDGIDLTAAITGEGASPTREHLYWEHHAGGGWQAARQGDWKAVRRQATSPSSPIELYDLANDPNETRDVAASHPDVVRSMAAIMNARTPAAIAAWNVASAPPPRERRGLIVAPRSLEPVANEWASYRREGGWSIEVQVVEPGVTGSEVQTNIRAWRSRHPDALTPTVLLLGDVGPAGIPTFAFPQEEPALLRGGEPTFASDHPYGLLEEQDERTLCAVGRVPAGSIDEARAALAKIKAYESSAPSGDWRRRITYVAGEGHFGPFDAVLEKVFLRFVDEMVPPSFDLDATYNKPDSLWCPPPDRVERTTLERLGEGSLLFNYIGHGHVDGLDTMRWMDDGKEKRAPILRGAALKELPACGSRHPIALMSCCSTGWFDREPTKEGAERDSLAELFLFHPDGPIAVVAGTRPTHPYGNALFQKEFTRELLARAGETLGEIDRRARREMLVTDDHDRALDLIALPIAKATNWKLSLEALRLMHVRMYALIGDPMMTVASPGQTIEGLTLAGPTLTGTIAGMNAGRVEAMLTTDRDESASTDLREPAPNDDLRARTAHNYPLVNERLLVRIEGEVRGGAFTLTLPSPLPPRASIVRIVATGTGVDGRSLEAFGGLRVQAAGTGGGEPDSPSRSR